MNVEKTYARTALGWLLALAWIGPMALGAPSSKVKLSTEDELLQAAREAPCDNRQRLEAVRELFIAAGAAPYAIQLDQYRRADNLRVEEKGDSEETILVGAHWDKVFPGCGAIDNWTGIVALAHIYRTFASIPTEKTIVFVAFGQEEEGLLGSRAMAKAIPKPERKKICAMVNLDSLGLTHPQVGRNLSSRKLTKATEDLAERMNIPFETGTVSGDSDSTSFLGRGIPALTIHGLPENFRTILHTDNDRAEKVHSRSLYLGYRLALALVAEIDQTSCDTWR